MTPQQILSLPELIELRAQIQSAYRDAMDAGRSAAALSRAIDRGHVQASAYDPNNTPMRRQADADEWADEAWRPYNRLFSAYAKRVDELYAENGHTSRRWAEFDSPEAQTAAAQNLAYLTLRGQYLDALSYGNRAARIAALTECELQMRTELGASAAAAFVRGLDPSNRAIYQAVRMAE